jgi:anaerobic selenocysteine-containing dehydrogenase
MAAATHTHYGFCNFCDAVCGLAIEHDGKQIIAVRGDDANPFSRGHVCPKGIAQQDIFNDPDRIRKPLRKTKGDWEEIGWDEAFAEAGERLAGIQKKHGDDALGFFFGNPMSHNYQSLLHLLPFARGLKSKNVYSAGSVDAFSRMLVSQLLFGNPAVLPVPDLGRTQYLLVLGANPVVSNGSIMTAPDMKRRLAELRARGGRLVVVDPRRTETAAVADEHHFITPDADALFLFALLHVFFAEGLARPERATVPVDGLAQIQALAAPFTPEAVAAHTGIGAETTRGIARAFAAAPGAACYTRMGTSVQSFGTLATWLADMVNVVTGNFDRPGGMMFSTPAVDLASLAARLGAAGSFGAYRSRVRGLAELNGELPVAALYDELATPGAGQIRGFISFSGNPVLSLPNGRRMDELLGALEYMVAIDFYVNETTRHAHLILPPVTALETDHYPLLELGFAVRNTAQYAPALFPKLPGTFSDAEILARLAGSIGRHRGGVRRAAGALHRILGASIPGGRVLDVLLRIGPHKLSLKKLTAHPHGLDLGPLTPRLAAVLATPDRRVNVAPPHITADVPRLQASLAAQREPGTFRLIGRRSLRSMNSWLHNSARLTAGKPVCVLHMHPEDAARLGVVSGASVALASPVGRIEVPVELTDSVMPGVLSLPFGWGHDRPGARLGVAAARAGASYNDLVPDTGYDPVSGASVLNGVVVRVEVSDVKRQTADAGPANPTALA